MWDEVRDCTVQTQEHTRIGAGEKKETQVMDTCGCSRGWNKELAKQEQTTDTGAGITLRGLWPMEELSKKKKKRSHHRH